MTWKFWQWFRSPEVNVELVTRKPESRIGFELMGAPICGWWFEEDYLKLNICGAGDVWGLHVTIDGFVIHTIKYPAGRHAVVSNGDVMVYSLIELVRQRLQVKPYEDHSETAPTLPCS